MSGEFLRLQSLLKECEKHKKRIERSYLKMAVFMPLDGVRFENLTEDEIEHIDQYIFRFSKLQDVLGEKLFRSLLINLGEEVRNRSFIDIFNRLDMLEIVSDYDKWLTLRQIRNEVSHEYDDSAEKIALKINNIYQKKDALLKYYDGVMEYVLKHRLLDKI